jgi:hypothetical protein
MIALTFDYGAASTFRTSRHRALLDLIADGRRPVQFHARVKDGVVLLRLALQGLRQILWPEGPWVHAAESAGLEFDPVVTVHPDRVFFEAFSRDQSVYGLVVAEGGLFWPKEGVCCGTTNVDFTPWLWTALEGLRSGRENWLRIDPVIYSGGPHWAAGRIERRAEVPESWLRGFLELHGAMALPDTCVVVRPVDLLSALRILRYARARTSPQGLRYEFEPGQPVRLVLEPWEEVIRLHGTEDHGEEQRIVRTWGRRRLALLEPLLPFAESVAVYLKGPARPSFYAVRLAGLTFVLGLTGWSGRPENDPARWDLLADQTPVAEGRLAAALNCLRERVAVDDAELAGLMGLDWPAARQALAQLCRRGRAIYDLECRQVRHRELLAVPPAEDWLFPPDPRYERAQELAATGRVFVHACHPRETRQTCKLRTPAGRVAREIIRRDWQVTGTVGDQPTVEIAVNDRGRITFGTCHCPFFQDHVLADGPCEHLLALHRASEPWRTDLPTSSPAAPEA